MHVDDKKRNFNVRKKSRFGAYKTGIMKILLMLIRALHKDPHLEVLDINPLI